jgi:hypothetical protein
MRGSGLSEELEVDELGGAIIWAVGTIQIKGDMAQLDGGSQSDCRVAESPSFHWCI